MPNIYIASGWFDEEGREKAAIEEVEKILKGKGLSFFSPMRSDQNSVGVENKAVGSRHWSIETFTQDKKMLHWADVMVCLYHGNYNDSGTCWEAGYFYGLGKPIVLVHIGDNGSNLMMHESAFANLTLRDLYKYNFRNMKPNFFEGRMF